MEQFIVKWFKHDTDASRSESLKKIEYEFGMWGYAAWFKLLERVAEKMDHTNRCHAEYPLKEWAKILNTKADLADRFLTFVEHLGNICRTNENQMLRIEIPNLLQKKDNYSKDLEAAGKKNPGGLISVSISKINKQINKEKENGIIPQKIIDYLNRKTGKHFKAVPGNTKFIRARHKEGASEADFYKVIDFKFEEWEGTDWEKFIRPETLFSAQHFDSYLNEAIMKSPKQKDEDRLAQIEEMKREAKERAAKLQRETLATESKGH